ncbi:MAG TPA: ATP-binding protein, partial [Planctomycetota bacterium]|nr:ATP-binding protein [Planctomycetota bacterium]
ERRLAEAERLAAVGRLTAGVAHEINNPLAGIGNYLALLERQGGDPERRREYLDLVRHGFERIRAIVRDLLNVASPPAPRREPVELPAVLEKVERVTRHDRGFRDIAWSHRYAPGLPAVSADPFALEQVFLNLALNARDAMPNGGAIAVDARPDPSDPRRVSIVFEDTGPGFPPDVLPRIFEPFFTTRAAGTGLGLSVTASIVRAHGGTIRAENREAGGARFLLALASCT